MSAVVERVIRFITDLRWQQVPPASQHMLRRCVLDLCGTLTAGSKTSLSRIAREASVQAFGGDEATLLLDGRRASTPGAALANGLTLDAMDMHDGYRPAKGHAGANILPAAMAIGEGAGWSGEDWAAAMVVGYEIALRAAVSLHQTARDYHTSGAWGTLGAAAVAARGHSLSPERIRHALGISEFYGPRSPMMRVINTPTMLKDGSGWGSMTGILAARLAAAGFTGAPAATIESEEVGSIWLDLGQRWRIEEIYFKPFACCRWAQPAIAAALELANRHELTAEIITSLQVETFEAATHLDLARPLTTEEAQYSLPYPLAAALVYGRLDPEHVLPPALSNPRVLDLADRVTVETDPQLEASFPKNALARVRIETEKGEVFQSGVHSAPGEPHNPLSDTDLDQKFTRITGDVLGPVRSEEIREMCWHCDGLVAIKDLITSLRDPAGEGESPDD